MFKGTIYITHDPRICLANLNTCKTITVVDESDYLNIPGKIGGSLLLPPYEALAALVDDAYGDFEYSYMNYLANNLTVVKFIDIILQALIVGTNILLLVEQEGPRFERELKQFFVSNFGIYMGDEADEFKYDPAYIPMILNRLYANDSIEKEYFLKLYPLELPLDQFIGRKLSYEYNIFFNTHQETEMYFKKLSKIMKNGGKIQGVVKRLG